MKLRNDSIITNWLSEIILQKANAKTNANAKAKAKESNHHHQQTRRNLKAKKKDTNAIKIRSKFYTNSSEYHDSHDVYRKQLDAINEFLNISTYISSISIISNISCNKHNNSNNNSNCIIIIYIIYCCMILY